VLCCVGGGGGVGGLWVLGGVNRCDLYARSVMNQAHCRLLRSGMAASRGPCTRNAQINDGVGW
jgi:hypothetical protein